MLETAADACFVWTFCELQKVNSCNIFKLAASELNEKKSGLLHKCW